MTFFSFGTGSLDPFSQISQSCSQPLNTKPGYLQQESESNSEITGFRSHLNDSISKRFSDQRHNLFNRGLEKASRSLFSVGAMTSFRRT